MALRPTRGGFLRPFGAGRFIREYLGGNGPEGSERIDASRGAAIDDIKRAAYKPTEGSMPFPRAACRQFLPLPWVLVARRWAACSFTRAL